jgi:hypothetical protein
MVAQEVQVVRLTTSHWSGADAALLHPDRIRSRFIPIRLGNSAARPSAGAIEHSEACGLLGVSVLRE